ELSGEDGSPDRRDLTGHRDLRRQPARDRTRSSQGDTVSALIVVENPQSWALEVPGAEVVSARDYLTKSRFTGLGRATVFNLCRSYAYQSVGYYVSLLATARGHRPFPSVTTIQDLRLSPVVKIASEELDQML